MTSAGQTKKLERHTPEVLLARRRRSAEEARSEILNAAEELLLSEGPAAVRLKRVADRVGLTHPGVLHHFGTVEHLLEELSQRAGRRVREDLLAVLEADSSGSGTRGEAVRAAFARLADPRRGRLLAWVVASGRDPFPPASEQGLSEVVRLFEAADSGAGEELSFFVELAVLAALGDALFGRDVRRRLGRSGDPDDAEQFRRRLLRLLAQQVRS